MLLTGLDWLMLQQRDKRISMRYPTPFLFIGQIIVSLGLIVKTIEHGGQKMRENLFLAIAKHKERTKEMQGDMGLRAGIKESRLCHIIKGRLEPTPEERASLARILGVPEDVLFEDNARKQPLVTCK
jgi:hypothetical protein